ncbi:PREDICTED: uncharacterized protein LOC104772479 [Camelina sativa]|uniref:Uncharacterized protein LOC104772479 n=1 Tax=Camelina sativa TaxID=90675 RepID=A0ABM0Y4L2_CAMSA|nr:PREDICTED: uncharacterized protein LOC104772479 [Camelina sativa]
MGNTDKETETSKSLNDQTLISPYFLHASYHTGHVQTPILLNGSNYERWAKLMTISLRTKRKLGFINGTLLRSTTDTKEAERWDMVNSMIIGWIYSSIEPHLRSSISVVSDASVMWAALKGRFSTSDDTRVHQLRAELAACRQEGQTVEEYFGKLKVYWDDLSDFEAAFTCCCGNDRCSSMTKYRKIQDKSFIHQFLMGLDNSRFGTARSNLLSRLGDLTLESVYSQIKQEETHLNTTRRTEGKNSVIGFSATATSITKSNTSMTCTHCGRTGHEKQQCFKLVGYPEWWGEQLTLGRGHSSRGRGSVRGRNRGGRGGYSAHQVGLLGSHPAISHITDVSTSSTSDSGIPNLTQSQWNSIANFVTSKKQNNTVKLSGKTEKLVIFGTSSRYDIIIDSGASHHMTGDINLLTHLFKIDPIAIALPDDGFTWATRQGTLNLRGKLVLHRVFYAPDLSMTLISVSQLLDEIASSVIFTKRFCAIQGQASRTLIGAGEKSNGVYHLTGAVVPQAHRVGRSDVRALWHRRLGHPSSKVLSFLSNLGAKLPARFWGESILTATHLNKCTPSVLLLGKSPFELLFKKPPTYDALRTFGCLCYAHKVRRSNDKFEERGVRCMFLGYPFGKKGWIVYDFKKDKPFVSRDVIFHENVFPFHSFESSAADSLTVVSPSTVHPSFFDDIDSPSSIGGDITARPTPASSIDPPPTPPTDTSSPTEPDPQSDD